MPRTLTDGRLVVEYHPDAILAHLNRKWIFPRYRRAVCPRCGNPLEKDSAFDTCGACDLFEHVSSVNYIGIYNRYTPDDLKNGIFKMKDESSEFHAKLFGMALALVIENDAPHLKQNPILTAVPSHPLDHPGRTFVPSVAIAQGVSRFTDIPFHQSLLVKTQPYVQKNNESIEERYANIEGKFIANEVIRNQSVIIVDDVMTTGATLWTCAHQCLGAGASRVDALVVGRHFIFREGRSYE